MSARIFSPVEVLFAFSMAGALEIFFFALFIFVGRSNLQVANREPPSPPEVPIAVKPVMDDAPLLKLGGKKVRAKLPDMWVKHEPIKQFEAKSAPSPSAEKTLDAIPTSSVAIGDAEAPPPDAEIVKKVDEDIKLMDASVDAATPNVEGPGAAGGVKEGTETDPLKARAVSLYRAKIIGWFNARFRVPVGQIPCDELKRLSASVGANVSPDGTVTAYSVGRASGNAVFDERVRAAMDSSVGQQVPPPPPLYPDVLPPVISLNFTGRSQKCE